MLYKYYCEVIDKGAPDDAEPKEAVAWVEDGPTFEDTKDNIRQLADECGYALYEDGEITETNAGAEMPGCTLEDRFYFEED